MNVARNEKVKPADLDAGVRTAWEFVSKNDDTLHELKGYGLAIARLSDLTSDDELRGAFWALGDAIQGHAEALQKGRSAVFHALHPVVYPGAREELAEMQSRKADATSTASDDSNPL